jgi:hypothetical protein
MYHDEEIIIDVTPEDTIPINNTTIPINLAKFIVYTLTIILVGWIFSL